MKHTLILAFSLFLLVSCTAAETNRQPNLLTFSEPTPVQQSPARISITSTAPQTKVNPTRTIKLINDPQTSHCLEILDGLPNNLDATGALIISGEWKNDRRYIHYFKDSTQVDFPAHTDYFSTSPDGKWVAYQQFDQGSYWLIFESSDKSEKRTLLIQKDWFLRSTWIDRQNMMININRGSGIVPPALVINVENNDQQEISSDFPDLKTSMMDPAQGMGLPFLYSAVVYNPSLEIVAYPAQEDGHNFIVLWDRQKQSALAKLEDYNYFHHNPVWSSDGKQVITAATTHWDPTKGNQIQELFSISLEGQIHQLTRFGNDLKKAIIGPISLSPNGRFVAFWLSRNANRDERKLQLFDFETQEVIDFCIPVNTSGYQERPVWSPDSRFIAVGDLYNEEQRFTKTILINVAERWAAYVGDGYPAGWLAVP